MALATVKRFITLITVEPVLFMYMVAALLEFITKQQLLYRKVCLESHSVSVCDVITKNSSYSEDETRVNEQTSAWIFYGNLCFTFPSLLSCAFLGSWGDKVDRRIPLILPSIGTLIMSVFFMVVSVDLSLPWWYLMLAQGVNGVFGGFAVALMATFSYVSAISTSRNRTIRIGFVEASIQLGVMVGMLASGVILDRAGFLASYIVQISVHVLLILYVCVRVRDTDRGSTETLDHTAAEDSVTMRPRRERSRPPCTVVLRELFDLSHVKVSLQCLLKRRESNCRTHVILANISMFVIMMGVIGQADVILLFIKHSFGNWTATMFGVYAASGQLLGFIAMLAGLPLVKGYFLAADSVLVIMGLLSRAAASVFVAFSNMSWMLFAAQFLGIFSPWASACNRSIMSRLVGSDEQGKLFAIMAILESAGSLLSSVLYNKLMWPLAMNVKFPGLAFLFTVLILLAPFVIIIWQHFDLGRQGYLDPIPKHNVTPEDQDADQAIPQVHNLPHADDFTALAKNMAVTAEENVQRDAET